MLNGVVSEETEFFVETSALMTESFSSNSGKAMECKTMKWFIGLWGTDFLNTVYIPQESENNIL